LAVGTRIIIPNGKPVPDKPTVKPQSVSLKKVQYGNSNDDVLVVQKALKKEVGLDYSSAPGTFGDRTKAAYAKFQRSLGYNGQDADGQPGATSLARLGKEYNFKVTR
jgi:hypothetical protein